MNQTKHKLMQLNISKSTIITSDVFMNPKRTQKPGGEAVARYEIKIKLKINFYSAGYVSY